MIGTSGGSGGASLCRAGFGRLLHDQTDPEAPPETSLLIARLPCFGTLATGQAFSLRAAPSGVHKATTSLGGYEHRFDWHQRLGAARVGALCIARQPISARWLASLPVG